MEIVRRALVLWIITLLPSLAQEAMRRGDYDLAVNCLDAYHSFNANNATTHLMLGWAYFKKDDLGRAIDAYSEAIRLAPNHAAALHQRASLYSETKKYARARADYEAVLRLQPENAESRLALVELFSSCPDTTVRNVARADEEAGRLDPHATTSQRAFARLAAAHAVRSELDQAIRWQRKALACMNSYDKEEKRRAALVLELYRKRKKRAEKAALRRVRQNASPPQDGGQ
ncbi:MAG TPA: tetratricopeptide repeat protein [Gemmataceae bacterium]|nr:tetratricopeptide repeat protein [Gemmataceae bacterium]